MRARPRPSTSRTTDVIVLRYVANNNPTNLTDPLGLRPSDSDFDSSLLHGGTTNNFRDLAIGLRPEERLAILRSFDDPVEAYINSSPHLAGLIVFTQWGIDSGRLDRRLGSDWWKAVNGGLELDVDAGRCVRSRSG